jgi:hypothetical protein
MDRFTPLSDQEIDELLHGRAPEGHADLRPVADLAAAVLARRADEPAPVMGYELRRAISDRARPPVPVLRHPRWRQALAASAAAAAFGVVGVAGALPAPIQDAVADAGRVVGVELPRSSDVADEAPGVETATSVLGDREQGSTGPTAAAPPDVTPGGAAPADPGTAGDREPATPAIPPAGEGPDDQDQSTTARDREPGSANAPDGAPAPEDAGPHKPSDAADPAPGPSEEAPAEVDPGPVRPRLA